MKAIEEYLSAPALEIYHRSVECFGKDQAIVLAGHSPNFVRILERLIKFAAFDEPIMITGDSGTGKEYAARASHILSPRRDGPFVPVNSPQYQDSATTVTELFGHARGAFTGSVGARKGDLELASAGSIFFDEVADLTLPSQKMLLRSLEEQEIKPMGANDRVKVNVRIISATNRPLKDMAVTGEFRDDLYYRLRFFLLEMPSLADRGEDGVYLVNLFLDHHSKRHGEVRQLSDRSIQRLVGHEWPGNAREAKRIAAMGYCMSDGPLVEPEHFEDSLEKPSLGTGSEFLELYRQLVLGSEDFWEIVHKPFMDRDIARPLVAKVIAKGLSQTRGSYRGLISLFNVGDRKYQKFMDFLRHQRLKPVP